MTEKVKRVDILMPMYVELDTGATFVMVNFALDRMFYLNGCEVEEDIGQAIKGMIGEKMQSPSVPNEVLNEAMQRSSQIREEL